MTDRGPSHASQFTTRFDSAVREYERQTGTSLSTHPLAAQLQRCDSIESLEGVFQGLVQDFTASRGSNGVVMKSLKGTLSGLHSAANTLEDSTGKVRHVERRRSAFYVY
jgi:hypothetical protein